MVDQLNPVTQRLEKKRAIPVCASDVGNGLAVDEPGKLTMLPCQQLIECAEVSDGVVGVPEVARRELRLCLGDFLLEGLGLLRDLPDVHSGHGRGPFGGWVFCST